jgi:glycosyltransferase involved in cell wall biosynthesis
MEKVSIVMPAHNEEGRINDTLKAYSEYFTRLKKENALDFEIVVVTNGCKDNTCDIVNGYRNMYPEVRLLDFESSGKGFAVIEGFKDSIRRNMKLIGFVDADGATPPRAFYGLIRNIRNNDGIIANRWDPRSTIRTQQTFLRKLLSRGFNLIVRSMFLLPHQDTQCGAKLFRKSLLEKITPKLGSSEWSFDVDLLFYARRAKARVISIPTLWEDKKGSKINVKKTPIKMFCSAVRLRLVHSPFKFAVRAHSKLPQRFKISSLIEKIK